MYKTDSTNASNSSMQSKSFVQLQPDLLSEENSAHNQDQLIIDQVFEHYSKTLKQKPKLAQMLISRKIDPEYIDKFQIGFADRSLGFELQSPKCLLGSRNRGHLQRLGLLKDSGHEFFRGALVIPFFDDKGQISGAYGRRPRHQRRSPAYHLYWNAQQVSLFNANDQRFSSSLVLCKSALDALTLLTAGFTNVVATMGMKGFNDVQLSRLQGDGVRSVYLAFDNTPPADRYTLLVAQALDAVGIQAYRVRLPAGQDVNSFALSQMDVSGAFRRLLEASAPLKQSYGALVSDALAHWQRQIETLEDCIQFYLEEIRHTGRSTKTLNANRVHLERFQSFCLVVGVENLADLTTDVLEFYRQYLLREKNVFTGKITSRSTQLERLQAVIRMLERLYYYRVIPEPLSPVSLCEAVN